MTVEHMPGDWSIRSNSYTGELEVVCQDPEDEFCPWVVATIHDNCGHDTDHAEDNARLIAAAPDLLAACMSVRALLIKLGGENHDPEFSEICAAIAKARG